MFFLKNAALLLFVCIYTFCSSQKKQGLEITVNDTSICCEKICSLKLGNFISVKGGKTPYRYKWKGVSSCSGCQSPKVGISKSTTYYITVTDDKENKVTDSLRIFVVACIDSTKDSDSDKVPDYRDSCLNVPGVSENFGCPWKDTDGDGVFDKDDECPKFFGLLSDKGCPVLDSTEKAVLKKAVLSLKFDGENDIISKISYSALDALAQLMMNKPGSKLLIEAHTDNIGTDEKNLILSQKRAEAVKKHLIKKGVDPAKLEAFGYGESRPVTDNDTWTGRQRNKRVELKILFR
jgi:outer membrane protein OmpA-like peptidoglycan-associated protein